jgi:uncharacterized protein (DUF1810 family)
MSDPHDLQRFVDAQAPVMARVDAELSAGAKTSHWMWFVFPQLRALGRSEMALRFARRPQVLLVPHALRGGRAGRAGVGAGAGALVRRPA